MKYVLDFDHTLMDTDKFVKQVDADGRRDILVTPGIWNYYNARDFLYDDVLDFLMAKPKEDLVILTAMTPSLGPEACDFQKEKLENAQMDDLVSEIIFMTGDKGPYLKKLYDGSPMCFVDDSIGHHDSVQQCEPNIVSFLMQRPGVTPVVSSENSAIHTIEHLAQVDAIIKTS